MHYKIILYASYFKFGYVLINCECITYVAKDVPTKSIQMIRRQTFTTKGNLIILFYNFLNFFYYKPAKVSSLIFYSIC